MALRSEIELTEDNERLRAEIGRLTAELAQREREAADNERQLQIYAEDLRETFKQERARSQELTRSYTATVRALSNAVEARDAYTGKHAERVAAYGIEIGRSLGLARPRRPRDRVRLPVARHRQGRDSRRDPVQARRLDQGGA